MLLDHSKMLYRARVIGLLCMEIMIKAQFISGCIEYLLSQVKKSSINIGHCKTYYEINIHQHEIGQENSWRRHPSRHGKPSQTVKSISFVYTCDTKKEQLGKKGVIEAVRFFFLSMKKCQSNPIGPLVLKHLKEHVEGLYTYLMRDKLSKDAVAKKITDDMDNFFVFIVKWNDSFNHWMIDYDINHILKYYVGYSCWADVLTNLRKLCYKNYNANFKLPD
jgi:hypothetical protein